MFAFRVLARASLHCWVARWRVSARSAYHQRFRVISGFTYISGVAHRTFRRHQARITSFAWCVSRGRRAAFAVSRFAHQSNGADAASTATRHGTSRFLPLEQTPPCWCALLSIKPLANVCAAAERATSNGVPSGAPATHALSIARASLQVLAHASGTGARLARDAHRLRKFSPPTCHGDAAARCSQGDARNLLERRPARGRHIRHARVWPCARAAA